MVQIAFANLPILVLGFLYPTQTVGFFALAMQLAGYILITQGILNYVMSPLFAEHQDNTKRLRQLFHRAVLLNSVAALPLFLLYFFYANELVILLFGATFADTAGILPVIALAQLWNVLCGPVGALLNMAGKDKAVMRVCISSLLVLIATNAVLIPLFGLYGAAWATTCVIIWQNTLLRLKVRHCLGI